VRTRILIVALTLLSSVSFAARLRQIAMIDLPGQPGFDSLAIANKCLLVAHSAANTVDIFDLAKRMVIAQVKHVRGASGIAVDDIHNRVYISSPDDRRIVVISSKTWDVEGVIPVQSDAEQIVYVPENNRLYLANSHDRTVSYVDLAKNNEIHTLNANGTPEYIVFDPVKKLIYATLQDQHAIAAYELDLTPVARWVLNASQPTGLALDSGGRRLYVAVRHAIITFDPDTGAELSRIGAPAGVNTLWLAPGGALFAASAGTVSVMKLGTGGLTHEVDVSVSVKGDSIAYDPHKQLLYLAGGREGRSKLLIMREVESNANAVLRSKDKKAGTQGQ
jgi:YVTN family beta-propeller protein